MIFNPGLVPQASGGGGAVGIVYTGDGTAKRTLTFPFTPSCVICLGMDSSSLVRATVIDTNYTYKGKYEVIGTQTISSDTFTTSFDGNSWTMPGVLGTRLNAKGRTYVCLVFPKA